MKTGDFVEVENCGIGKIINVYEADGYHEDGMIVINIAEVKYYRNINKDNEIIDDLNDATKVTEKEYVKFLKVMIKQLKEKSKNKRKTASDYNKSVNGEATKKKGKVSLTNGHYTSMVENSFSSYHRELLTDAKKMKETIEKLMKELEFYKNKTA